MTTTRPRPEVIVLSDPQAIFQDAANRFVRLAEEAIQARGQFTVALAGGSTPKGLYQLLASEPYRNQIEWPQVHVFWGDERSVPPDHADSNFRMANEALLSKVPLPAGNIHRMPADSSDIQAAAAAYEQELRSYFGEVPFPRFDLILLGMGPDGHTASLFPETEALKEQQKWVVANWVPKFNTWRMTFSYPVLNAAFKVMFMAAGADKTEVLKEVLEGEVRPAQLPSQAVRPTEGRLIWLVDQAAAAQLSTARTHG